ncbi:MAG TPA: 30S ribosomal protein S16 [Chloroflexota bacterium]|nr:30S ribosomal protein S16 [Chloroflexota bacterium]
MVRIRLRRTGAKGQPSYRVVVADSHSPRDGRFIEVIGHYNPRQEPSVIVIDKEKALAWMAKGAQPSESVHRLMARVGILEYAPLPVKAAKTSDAAAAS